MTHLDSQRTTPPPRLAVDGRGYVWRVYNDGHWSMAPTNPDNELIPEPITYYERSEALNRLREMHRQAFPDTTALNQADFCHECAMAWPCPTRRVLDGEQ